MCLGDVNDDDEIRSLMKGNRNGIFFLTFRFQENFNCSKNASISHRVANCCAKVGLITVAEE